MLSADGIQEVIETMRELRACNARESYLESLEAKFAYVEKRAVVTEFGSAAFVVGAQMIFKFGIPTIALMGIVFLSDGSLTVPAFFMFLFVASRLYDPLQIALQNLAAIIATRTNISRMNEILDHGVQSGSKTLENRTCRVEFEHVGFAYNDGTRVLDDVSFAAEQGQATALIGPSGGGKMTVSRLVVRFWDASQGTVTIGGMDISKVDPETLLSLFSIVFQYVTLFNNTVIENIRIGRKGASDEDVMRAADLANCREFIEKLPQGWNTNIGENGCEFSSGERQRISIARAFLKGAPILLLDEATDSLDVDQNQKTDMILFLARNVVARWDRWHRRCAQACRPTRPLPHRLHLPKPRRTALFPLQRAPCVHHRPSCHRPIRSHRSSSGYQPTPRGRFRWCSPRSSIRRFHPLHHRSGTVASAQSSAIRCRCRMGSQSGLALSPARDQAP